MSWSEKRMGGFVKSSQFKESLLYVCLVYGFSGLIALFVLKSGVEDGILYRVLVVLATASPSITAILLMVAKLGISGAFHTLKEMLDFKLAIRLYWVILILPFAFMLAGKTLAWLIFGLAPIWIVIPDTIVTSLVSPLGEEFGWRGYLTGRLLKHFNPVQSSVILGLVWAGWHYWFYLIPGPFSIEIPFLFLVLSCIADTAWYTYFFVRSGGSVVTALLFHFAYNLSYRVIPIRTSLYSGNSWPYLLTVILELLAGFWALTRKLVERLNEKMANSTDMA